MKLNRKNAEEATNKIFLPEKNLLAAVLQRAIQDIVQNKEREPALIWLLEPKCEDGHERGGFDYFFICDALDLEPYSTREGILKLISHENNLNMDSISA